MTDSRRIVYLDAFRGLALLLVIGFHAYARWPAVVPYGDDWASFPLFKAGTVGVCLFFLISGFVILMTLERARGPAQFLYGRWLRLFPAMLVCSAGVFATAGFFHERPMGSPSAIGLLPGLLFVEPVWLERLLSLRIAPLEGVFWSLYVEFKFYVLAAALFFLARRERFVAYIASLFLFYIGARLLGHLVPSFWGKLPFRLADQLSLDWFGWFAAGAAWYRFAQDGRQRHMWLGMTWALLSAMVFGEGKWVATLAGVLVSLLFGATVWHAGLQRWISQRGLLFFGLISYPLYLMHENMMLSWIVKLGQWMPWMPSHLLPLPALALVVAPAYFITIQVEPRIKAALDRMLRARQI